MGLREKVALATVAVITAQIVCSHCMPRGLPNCSVKSHINSLISPKSDSIREFKTNRKLKKNSYNNITTGNSSKVLLLPNVKEPTDFEAGGYYRFYCDYPHAPKIFSKTQLHTRNFKREAKQKLNLDLGPRDKGQLPITSSGLAGEPPRQPYCFRKSSFFPEVEYPLSARDMWIPKYWSRLLDAEVPHNVKIDAHTNENQQKNKKSIYSSYENSPLYDIIKTLNNHNKTDTDRLDYNNLGEFVTNKSESESKYDGISPYRNLNTTTTVLPEYTTPSEYTTPEIHSRVLPFTETTKEAYPVLETATASSVVPPVTSAITMATEKENFFTLPYTTSPILPNIATTISSVTSSDLRNSDFDVIGGTTTLPFEDFTTPITQSITSADNFISIPTTVASVQAHEREASLTETNTEPTTTPELLSFISSTEKNPEQELRDHTTPMQFTTLSTMKSSDMIHFDFDKIDVSTASPSDHFTSPMTYSEALDNNSIPYTQTEKIPTTLSTVASTRDEEGELRLTETNIKPTTTSPLLSLSSTTENKPEEKLRDYTTPMQSTPSSKFYTDDKVSLTDSIQFFSNSSDFLPSSNLTLENTHFVNDTSISSNKLQKEINDLDTNESLSKHEVLQHDVDVKPPGIPSASIDTLSEYSPRPKDMLLSDKLSFSENPNQLDTFQGRVVENYYENTTNNGILQLCASPNSNSSSILTDNCKENWVNSPNDSYITWESIPECSDECFIFVDTENASSSTVPSKPDQLLMTESKYFGEVTKNVTSIPDSPAHTVAIQKTKSEGTPKNVLDNISKSSLTDLTNITEVESDQNPQITGIVKYPADNGLRILDNIQITADSVSVADNANSTILTLPLFSEYPNNSISNIALYDIGNTTKNGNINESQGIVKYLIQESNIDKNMFSAGNNLNLSVKDMNSTSENIDDDVDETWASYTEIPYDSLVFYPKDVNDTWTANGNEYVLYQQMPPEDSDDTTQFFLNTAKTSGLLNDLILTTN